MKMTEVGWIPKDWEVKTIGQLFFFKNGLNKGKEYFGHGIPIVNYMDVFKNNGLRIPDVKGRVDLTAKEIANFDIKKGDVFFTRTSETPEEVGLSAVLLEDIPNGVFSGFLLRARPITNELDANYCEYCFLTKEFRNAVISNSTYTTRALTNGKSLSLLSLPIPQKDEQRRIASVLSDTDSLIASLSRTIEKKRLVKQGAMQQLLTGKTRLKGFSGEWVEKVIGNIGKTYNGITGKTKADFGCGNARYITFLNVLNNPIIDINILERVNINFDEGQNEVRRGDLFFNTSSETPEEVGICATLKQNVEEVYLNSFCFGFRISDEDVDNQYLAYYFRSEQGRALMTMLAQGATRYNLSKDNFNKSCIVLPPTRDEQQAIANILTTMDNEIASLEAELQKYKFLKQGMMQKLLTGQIRLK